MFRGLKAITAFGHLVWPVGLRVWKLGERMEPIWMEASEVSCSLSGDRISLNLFTLILITRKETLIFSRH